MVNEHMTTEIFERLEKCSSYIDGELSEQELDDILAYCAQDDDIDNDLQTYHLIGDVMRSADFANSHVTLRTHFNIEHLRARIAREPHPLSENETTPQKERHKLSRAWPKWIGFASVPSLALLAIVGVFVINNSALLPPAATENMTTAMVSTEPLAVEAQVPAVKMKDRVLKAASKMIGGMPSSYYMTAHQQFGYGNALNSNYIQANAVQTTAQR